MDQESVQKCQYEKIRVEGIHKYNLKILSQATPDLGKLMREKQPKYEDSVVKCAECDKYVSNRSFYKHRSSCGIGNAIAHKPLPLKLQEQIMHKDQQFQNEILSKFRDTPAGNLCREDSIIKQVGYRHYCLRRAEESKSDEIRKSVMSEMRELARLYLAFKSQATEPLTTEDMFSRKHKDKLFAAIEAVTEKPDGDEKYGLKLQINAIMLRAMKCLRGFYNDSMQDEKAQELERFQQAYTYHVPEMYGRARYKTILNSLDKARCPEKLPLKSELQKLRLFMLSEIDVVVASFTEKKITWLRSLLVGLLTLWNARRGDEGSRILISEFEDAMQGRWIPPHLIEAIEDKAEKFLIDKYKLAYMHGKGRKFVPLLIPITTIEAMNLLLEKCNAFGVKKDNPFFFATKGNNGHASGWHALNCVAQKAGVLINATANRHYVSTLFASLEMSPADEEIFMDHMGHDKPINKANYQCPQGLKEVHVMGKLLQSINTGKRELNNLTDFIK
jgi:hypothetical protein